MTAPGTGFLPSSARVAATGGDNATLVKQGPGAIDGFVGSSNGANAYIKFYDLGRLPTAADTPFATVFMSTAGYQAFYDPPNGRGFVNGLAYRITGAPADNDATAVSAAALQGSLEYY